MEANREGRGAVSKITLRENKGEQFEKKKRKENNYGEGRGKKT
jgi:hypothetical protein